MYWDYRADNGFPKVKESYVILRDKTQSPIFSDYTILVEYRFSSGTDMIFAGKWADENLSGAWLIGSDISGFSTKEDAMLFKLTWGCNYED